MSALSPLNSALCSAKHRADMLSEHANVAYFVEGYSADSRNYHINALLENYDKLVDAVAEIRAIVKTDEDAA